MNMNGLVIGVLVALSAILIGVSSKIIVKRETEAQVDNQSNGYSVEKRPFCNAFTGCGKKRSNNVYENVENRDLVDPLMRLSRRILKEAKQWELLHNQYNNEVPI
ncbi:unnamed protein product [Oppiella nova]|uniref:Crustacean cardioactive peptide n=1 Tax=Oppiella nova TaxID=334625 RepID=A0A7R9MD42_9ACAR|nr:unnamed protein product [Oppiella nova]CAG2175147.1 unnamed protein product [Oppiella nova]